MRTALQHLFARKRAAHRRADVLQSAMTTRAPVTTTVSLAEAKRLQQLAEDRRISMADLLRHAIKKTYPSVQAAKEAEDESW